MLFFITGTKGFLGRHLAKKIGSIPGNRVIGIGHGAWQCEDYSRWGVSEWLEGDINFENLSTLANKHGYPSAIFHIAGGSAVYPSLQAPQKDFIKSVFSASSVCEWIRIQCPSSHAILASSAAVYGAGHKHCIPENSQSTPYSPYGFHKKMCELTFESYAKNFGVKASAVRLFSIYGTELRKQLLWDICMRLTSAEKTLTLGGVGDELRDWLHVDDACELMLRAFKLASIDFPIINGGTGIPTSVKNIAEAMLMYWGGNTQLHFNGQSRAGDPKALVADITLAKSLGFTASKKLHEGLSEYVSWFKTERLHQ